ncbi:transposase family protein [Kitasatospora griseola]|uniref:transposase family protein n=1 Tax=Kitasatospora griseola TaxID=2064 RepID=UPI0037FC41A0
MIDATEIRVRRPAAHRTGRNRFVSGKSRMNAMKALVITDGCGRVLFCGEVRAGSVADIAQARDAGLVDLLADTIHLEILADAGHQGLAAQTCGQVVTPPRKRCGKYLEQVQWLMAHHEQARFAHSSRRMPVEHGTAHLKNWRTLARHHGRRDRLPDTIRAVAGLPSDQQASRKTELKTLPAGKPCDQQDLNAVRTAHFQPCTRSIGQAADETGPAHPSPGPRHHRPDGRSGAGRGTRSRARDGPGRGLGGAFTRAGPTGTGRRPRTRRGALPPRGKGDTGCAPAAPGTPGRGRAGAAGHCRPTSTAGASRRGRPWPPSEGRDGGRRPCVRGALQASLFAGFLGCLQPGGCGGSVTRSRPGVLELRPAFEAGSRRCRCAW